MGLFKRISDIISANLNEMTESFEDPEKMLRQAIREMETSIADATHETAKVLANDKLMAKELANNEQQAKQWQTKAEQAVNAGDDNLARRALSRKQEHQKLVTALQDQLTATQQASKTLRHQLDGMRAKLAEAKRSLATLSARNKAAEFKKKMNSVPAYAELGGLNDDAFAKFERLRETVERAEAEADALAELRGHNSSVESDFASFERSTCDDLDDELQALKKKCEK